jgi:hypothetical protein
MATMAFFSYYYYCELLAASPQEEELAPTVSKQQQQQGQTDKGYTAHTPQRLAVERYPAAAVRIHIYKRIYNPI